MSAAQENGFAPDGADAMLNELLNQIALVPNEIRHAALVDWARSDLWDPLLMMLVGWQGTEARAAYLALKRDLDADAPGRRWDACEHAVGRQSIYRLLAMEGHAAAVYACMPFRTWLDEDGRSWIAGAIGAPPMLDTKRAMRWRHIDVRDVILWDPRTNEARLAGEHHTANTVVMPDRPEGRLSIWGDCGAFFRAWAARRARAGVLAIKSGRGEWAHPIVEPDDSNLPGALVIGNVLHAPWPHIEATTVVAQAGLSPTELQAAAYRAARLPMFQGV